MKKTTVILLAAAVLAAGCQKEGQFVPDLQSDQNNAAVGFNARTTTFTKAGTQSAFTDILPENDRTFRVYGEKFTEDAAALVFNNYEVHYLQTNEWSYLYKSGTSSLDEIEGQSVKYWDYNAGGYSFWACAPAGQSAVRFDSTAMVGTFPAGVKGYEFLSTGENSAPLSWAYTRKTFIPKPSVGSYGPVSMMFYRMNSKVRLGIYENVTGFSVSNVRFHTSATDDKADSVAVVFGTDGVITGLCDGSRALVTLGDQSTDANAVIYDSSDAGTKDKVSFKGNVTRNAELELGSFPDTTLATVRQSPTFAVVNDVPGAYLDVIPQCTEEDLFIKVDYTLTATDGSGETIQVSGATARIPKEYLLWQPNYAYSYVFAISNRSSGGDGEGGDTLYPISFETFLAEDQSDLSESEVSSSGQITITAVNPNGGETFLTDENIRISAVDGNGDALVIDSLKVTFLGKDPDSGLASDREEFTGTSNGRSSSAGRMAFDSGKAILKVWKCGYYKLSYEDESCVIKIDTGAEVPHFIDEAGTDHGKGIVAGGLCWAPVNSGYSEDTPNGLLYQWGRKYGQGYGNPVGDGNTFTEGKTEYSIQTLGAEDSLIDSEANKNVFFKNSFNWYKANYTSLLHNGIWSYENDPCPDGWRVPSAEEIELFIMYGNALPIPGGRNGETGLSSGKNSELKYWTYNNAGLNGAYTYDASQINYDEMVFPYENAYPVRCVHVSYPDHL